MNYYKKIKMYYKFEMDDLDSVVKEYCFVLSGLWISYVTDILMC